MEDDDDEFDDSMFDIIDTMVEQHESSKAQQHAVLPQMQPPSSLIGVPRPAANLHSPNAQPSALFGMQPQPHPSPSATYAASGAHALSGHHGLPAQPSGQQAFGWQHQASSAYTPAVAASSMLPPPGPPTSAGLHALPPQQQQHPHPAVPHMPDMAALCDHPANLTDLPDDVLGKVYSSIHGTNTQAERRAFRTLCRATYKSSSINAQISKLKLGFEVGFEDETDNETKAVEKLNAWPQLATLTLLSVDSLRLDTLLSLSLKPGNECALSHLRSVRHLKLRRCLVTEDAVDLLPTVFPLLYDSAGGSSLSLLSCKLKFGTTSSMAKSGMKITKFSLDWFGPSAPRVLDEVSQFSSIEDLYLVAKNGPRSLDFKPLAALKHLNTLRVESLREPINLDLLLARVPLHKLCLYDTELEPQGVVYSSDTLECISVSSLGHGCDDLLRGRFPSLKSFICRSITLSTRSILYEEDVVGEPRARDGEEVIKQVKSFVARVSSLPLVFEGDGGQEEQEEVEAKGEDVFVDCEEQWTRSQGSNASSSSSTTTDASAHGEASTAFSCGFWFLRCCEEGTHPWPSLAASMLQELSPLSTACLPVRKLGLAGWEYHPDLATLAHFLGTMFPSVTAIMLEKVERECPLLQFLEAWPLLTNVSAACDNASELPDSAFGSLVTMALQGRRFTLILSMKPSWEMEDSDDSTSRGQDMCVDKLKAHWKCMQSVLPGSKAVTLRLHVPVD